MFGRVGLLLTAAFIVVLFGEAFGEECIGNSWGSAFGAKFNLNQVILDPHIADWTVTIEKPALCGLVYGVFVTRACDYDVPPSIRFKERFLLAVHRNGQLEYPASVDITVYCALHRKLLV